MPNMTDLFSIGYRYSRRDARFILVWKPEGARRVQEIDVPVRILALVLPETFASICSGYTSGCTDVSESQLIKLGFLVPEVPSNACGVPA